MKKQLRWLVVAANGEVLPTNEHRVFARSDKRFYTDNMLAEWLADVHFPIKIVRQEWHLLEEKEVR